VGDGGQMGDNNGRIGEWVSGDGLGCVAFSAALIDSCKGHVRHHVIGHAVSPQTTCRVFDQG